MTIIVDNKEFEAFHDLEVILQFNSIASGFSFTALYDPSNQDLVNLLKPLQFKNIVIKEGNFTVLTGTILNHRFKTEKSQKLAVFSGYSTPGVLGDCQIPVDLYPLEFNGLSLADIAAKICQRFNIKVVVDPEVSEEANEPLEQLTAEQGEKIKDFISKACAQKNLVLTHDQFGQLVITKTMVNQEIVTFFDEQTPAIEIDLSVNGQNIHGPITVLKQADFENDNAAEATLENAIIPREIFRPKTKIQTTGTDTDTVQAARNALANQLREGIACTIKTDRWFWLNGKTVELMYTNTVVGVRSENVYVNGVQRWFVEKVTLRGNSKEQTGLVNLVVPEVYNGQLPKNIF